MGSARRGVVTVGGAAARRRRMPRYAQFVHEGAHPVAVDRQSAFAAQLRGHGSGAVGRPLARDPLAVRPHPLLLLVVSAASRLTRVQATARHVHDATDHRARILSTQPLAYLPPLLPAESTTAFFATSTPSVRRPTRRSNSPMRGSASCLSRQRVPPLA